MTDQPKLRPPTRAQLMAELKLRRMHGKLLRDILERDLKLVAVLRTSLARAAIRDWDNIENARNEPKRFSK